MGNAVHVDDLIDTLWNVKEKATAGSFGAATDLIDTLWNVKPVPYAVYYEDDTGFNRYIVECKGGSKNAKGNCPWKI